MCKRTVVLHNGRLRHDGDTNEAISLFHDLLGEAREIDEVSPTASDEEQFDQAAVVERFELLGPDGLRTNHVNSNDVVSFEIDLRFIKDADSPILGFSVFNGEGVQVYAESTAWRGGASYKAGELARATIQIRPLLATGSYSCVIGLYDLANTILAPDARPLLFYVGGRSGIKGVADLRATIDVQRLTAEPNGGQLSINGQTPSTASAPVERPNVGP
jgi:hypothetical protein